MPSSFNVLEAFFPFRKDLLVFDLAEEREHLFSLTGYIDWYTKGGLPEEFRLAADSLQEGIIHSYTTIGDAASFLITGDEIDFRIAGMSLIRHGREVVAMLLAGKRQRPAGIRKEERLPETSEGATSQHFYPPGKEDLRPAEHLTEEDRFLEGTADFERVIVATRVNADRVTHDLRYILVDHGRGFNVLTDDPRVLEAIPLSMRQKFKTAIAEQFPMYEPLFAAALTMLYLPVYFAENGALVAANEVATLLRSERQKRNVREALDEFGPQVVRFERSILTLPTEIHDNRSTSQRIEAPELQFSSRGYWKAISPDEVGEDQDGKPIFGKTWVHVQDSWVQTSAERVFIARTELRSKCPDPGYIYIMRSGSHDSNVFKIGLTRRSVSARARDLTNVTAAPTQFLEIASWQVGDCAGIERAIHAQLEYCRINKKREFFRAPLGQLIKVIESVISEEDQ
jgi:hypothetical protein